MRFWKSSFLITISLAISSPVYADLYVEAVPTNWKLQDYISGVVNAYYVGTSCYAGGVSFPASATIDDKNRFWALVLSAKSTGKPVGIYYETVTGNCQITSFYAP